MEITLLVAIALGLIVVDHHQAGSTSTTSGSSSSSSQPGAPVSSGAGPYTDAPPAGTPPAQPAQAPGAYPAGTPGTYPVLVSILGGDGFGVVNVIVNGRTVASVGPRSGEAKTFTFGPGTWVTFQGQVQGGLAAIGTAFDHWDGPGGISARQDQLTVQIGGGGWVRGVFATLGLIGV